ncbi:MAG: hypothetical protein AAF790_13490, partial [Planctomycetota bacterium]
MQKNFLLLAPLAAAAFVVWAGPRAAAQNGWTNSGSDDRYGSAAPAANPSAPAGDSRLDGLAGGTGLTPARPLQPAGQLPGRTAAPLSPTPRAAPSALGRPPAG